jgi:hypothetical protein
MTDYEIQLAKTVAMNCQLLTQLTRIVINVTERAVALGAFDERAAVLRADCEQLLACVRDVEKQQAPFARQFGLP